MTDDELKLLEQLEAEGILSKGTVKKIRTAFRSYEVFGAKRTLFFLSVTSVLIGCGLVAVGVGSPLKWLTALAFSLAVVAVASAAFLFFVAVRSVDVEGRCSALTSGPKGTRRCELTAGHDGSHHVPEDSRYYDHWWDDDPVEDKKEPK